MSRRAPQPAESVGKSNSWGTCPQTASFNNHANTYWPHLTQDFEMDQHGGNFLLCFKKQLSEMCFWRHNKREIRHAVAESIFILTWQWFIVIVWKEFAEEHECVCQISSKSMQHFTKKHKWSPYCGTTEAVKIHHLHTWLSGEISWF